MTEKNMKIFRSDIESSRFRLAALQQPHDRSPHSIKLAIGARVMLTTNMLQEAGLVNGSTGTVYDVLCHNKNVTLAALTCESQKIAAEKHLKPLTVLVQFDKEYYSGSLPSFLDEYGVKRVVPIVAVASTATFAMPCTDGRGKTSSIRVTRWQLPLRVCWAITIHKTQGMTCDNGLLVDVGGGNTVKGAAYVAVSRVRRLDDLFLTGTMLSESHFVCNPSLLKEYARLKKLATQTKTMNDAMIE